MPNPPNCDYRDPPKFNIDGCECKDGQILSEPGGKCIKIEDCPTKPKCGYNEVEVTCRQICPPQNCEIAYTEYACGDETKICEPGCNCRPGYLRNSSRICIPNDECPNPSTPVCGVNEIARDCRRICPPQTCLSKYALFKCKEDIPCEPGCDCIPGHLRNEKGVCIPSEKCPPPCSISDQCKRTCAMPNPPNCDYRDPPKSNIDGCECKHGQILSELGGKCINIEDCPKDLGCNGDPHSRATLCPNPCPSTCDAPNATPCKKMCDPIGCSCEDGYMLSSINGRCTLADKCPNGNPCGKNAHFVPCKVNCPRDYCPVDDSRAIVQCDPPKQCLSGCVCNLNHKRKSYDDPRCIVSSDCPPVNCTRPNEEWDRCKSACLAENCEDANNQPITCNTLLLDCQPGCICKKNHFRNKFGICVPARKCPCPISDKCKRTCAMPNPPNCDYRDPPKSNIDGCECKYGQILSELGGKCINIEDCPKDLGCNGDPHSRATLCPNPCPSTCDAPNATPCKKMCDPIGCSCEDGYMLSSINGRCTLADKCPNGNPCGKNAHFVPCKVNCPRDYCPVDDSRAIVQCDPPKKCLSGCVCNLNHKRKSYDDPRCIVSSDCPPVNCTRPNEEWDRCKSVCLAENCEGANNQPITCNTLLLDCQPACICKKNHFRNKFGICVPARKCPCPISDKCKRTCAMPNPPNCDYRDPPKSNIDGCECKDGQILSKLGGKCINIEDCPKDLGCNGDPHSRATLCPNPCPSTCDAPNATPCKKMCDPIGCSCEDGYMLSSINGRCTLADKCPNGNPCGKNAHFVPCKVNCPRDYCPVDDSRAIVQCDPPKQCLSGCVCNLNHKRKSYDDPRCIVSSDCPPVNCTRPNEEWDRCKSACLAENCEDANNQPITCNTLLLDCQPGCICKKNHFRNKFGICVPARKCPCPISDKCKRTCAMPNPPNCDYRDPPKSNIDGCECKYGQILSELGGKCINIEDCPKDLGCNGDLHSRTTLCPNPCPSTCDAPNATPCKKMCDPIGCSCEDGYMLSSINGRCILADKCPNGNPCGKNAHFVPCKVNCPRDYCPVDDSRAIVQCDPPKQCLSGCVCNLNHKRKSYDDPRCIVSSDCPPVNCTRPNEEWDRCKSACLAENCEDANNQPITCNTLLLDCQPGCICKKNHFRNKFGICVPARKCPCPISDKCKRTCAMPNPPNCDYRDPPKSNIDGCECKHGQILSELGGKCINIEDCPKDLGCNGDLHSRTTLCPNPCPSTCDAPNATPCKKMCDPIGCSCEDGYMLSSINGRCILADKCPNGNPCGKNAHFVPCKVNCPRDYCPVDDSRAIVQCDPPKQCLSGCVCNLNHKRKSYDDPRCIVSSDCPPVNCTRPNEEWDRCKSACLAENCEDANNQPITCNTLLLDCQPGCICKKNHFRNKFGICVPARKCPCPISDKCKRTCAMPNPPNCDYRDPPKSNIDGCECKHGQILSELGGKCINIEDCPKDLGCNGDLHSRTTLCPNPCPSTCDAPNATPCKKMCDPIGCSCEDGYMLSSINGRCILADKCPNGNPCGKNAHFVPCKVNCPRDYCPVDDSRAIVQCDPPKQCLSGCVCNLNHKRKSYDDPRCIVSSDCPPVNCTRPNEEWDRCKSACLAENCEDANNQPITCNTLLLDCQPGCICKKNHFRNKFGICVPARKCPCPISDKCKRTCAMPNPPNCDYRDPPKSNIDGCECKHGQILSELGGKCINIEDCPKDLGCNGDPHSRATLCPNPCPSTCDAPNATPCKKMCDPIGCSCEAGYMLSSINGRCILADKCPNGNPCGKNAHFVPCKVNCPRDYCPVDDSRAIVQCDPPKQCLSGCVCNLNHKRKSYDDPRCIVSSDCPPVCCTRPDEEWHKCPSACLAENCEDVDNQPSTCNTLVLDCQPACICKKNHFRNDSGICIPAGKCPC